HLPDLRVVDKAIAIAIDALEPVFQKGRCFVLGDLAVVVGVGLFQSLPEFIGIHAAQPPLSRSALTIRWSRRPPLTRTPGNPAGWRSAWSALKPLFGRQFAIAITVQLQQDRAGSDDLARRKFAIAIRIEGAEQTATGRCAGRALGRAGRALRPWRLA